MRPEQVARRRAVEALRSGVPSWDAVAALGSGQSAAEDRFAGVLEKVDGGASSGLLIGAGFGAGKSHLLTHLASLALDRGFAVSTVVVSKETPLFDPAKVYRAAVESLQGPARGGGVLAEAAASLDADSDRYRELVRWLNSPAGPDERFAATLHVHERLRGGSVPDSDETVEAIVRFWAGEPLRMPDLRRALKEVGAAGMFAFGPLSATDLAHQRTRFAARLLRAAGYAGWVVLFDEVELIGRYSLLQRGRSYAQVAQWLHGDPSDRSAPLAAVLAVTDDFAAAVLAGKDDRTKVPSKLRDKQTPEWSEIATFAEKGIRALEREVLRLVPPDAAELDRAYTTVKGLHGQAYDWAPPDVPGLERLGATRMRQYVRAWINAWDLVRLDPDYEPTAELAELVVGYEEDEALEQPAG
jgi:hypothetical protein